MSDEVYRAIRMSSREVDSLLRELDTSSSGEGADDQPRRAHARLEYRVGDVLIAIKHPGEAAVSKYLVATRNLSAGGLSFMYGGFLHVGTLCSIVLTDTNGKAVKLLGVVRSCRLVARAVHEIGVQFTKKVDPARFLRDDAKMTSNDPGVLDTKLPTLTGRALFVSEIECERSAAKTRLSAMGLEVEVSESVKGATAEIGAKGFDLVLLDSALGEMSTQAAALAVRSAGYAGALVCIADEQDVKALTACREISAIVRANAGVRAMLDIVASVHNESTNPAPTGAVYSVIAKDRSTRVSIDRFISAAGTAVKDIGEALQAKRYERLREICEMLRRSGWENGFPAFGEATRRVITLIEADRPESDGAIRIEAERLCGLCSRLRAGVEEQDKAQQKVKEATETPQAPGAPGAAEPAGTPDGGEVERAA